MAEWQKLQGEARHGFRVLRAEVGSAIGAIARQGEMLPLRLNLQRIDGSLRRAYQALGRAVFKHHSVQPPLPSETVYEKIFSEIDLLLDEKKQVLQKIGELEEES